MRHITAEWYHLYRLLEITKKIKIDWLMRFHGRVYFERFYAKKEAAYLRKHKYSDPKEAKLKFFHLYNDKKRLIDALPLSLKIRTNILLLSFGKISVSGAIYLLKWRKRAKKIVKGPLKIVKRQHLFAEQFYHVPCDLTINNNILSVDFLQNDIVIHSEKYCIKIYDAEIKKFEKLPEITDWVNYEFYYLGKQFRFCSLLFDRTAEKTYFFSFLGKKIECSKNIDRII